MSKLPVIAIFDVGKTNKKLLLFDEAYQLKYEESTELEEIKDEEGFPCEDIEALTDWIKETYTKILDNKNYAIKAINFSGYGASFVLLNENLQVIQPLYNYLKPFPESLKQQFYQTYGGESLVAKQTASPVLGNLNSGMQLYRLKYEKPNTFSKIKYALHLPQYLSFVLTGKLYADVTSIGCHTNLWDFQNQQYHKWVQQEKIDEKFPAISKSDALGGYATQQIPVGVGLHDSSAALIPYLTIFKYPFILLSTGTWCISLNPFNHTQLSDHELHQDCLCYLSYTGKPVKASRLFAGYEHEQQTKRLAEYFNQPNDYYKKVTYDPSLIKKHQSKSATIALKATAMVGQSAFAGRDLSSFYNYETAYHQLIADLIVQQVASTSIVLKGTKVKKIFVDGGFSKNPIYMSLLAEAFPSLEVYAASVAQASSLGAAFVMHQYWNHQKLPADLIDVKKYSVTQQTLVD